MKTNTSALALFIAAAALLPTIAFASEIKKDNNTGALNTGSSWIGGTAPGTGDVAVFDSEYAYATVQSLTAGGLVNWNGIRIGTPGAAVAINNATAGNEVILGSSGIDMSTATADFNIQKLKVSADQTWNIATGKNFTVGGSGNGLDGNLSLAAGTASATISVTGGGTVNLNNTNTSLGNIGWNITNGSLVRAIWNGANSFGSGAITLGGGGIATGTSSTGSNGNWTWTNNISLTASTASFIDNQNPAGSNRWLKLAGNISGSGDFEFRNTSAGTMANTAYGFIVAGDNTNTGTVTIAKDAKVRVGGSAAGATNVDSGNSGKLAADSAKIINNGNLTFSRRDAHTVSNDISGSGTLNIGLNSTDTALATSTQVVTLTGNNTYSTGTEIYNGTLAVDSFARIGSGFLSVKNNGIFRYTGTGSESTTRALWLDTGASTFDIVNAGATLTFDDSASKNKDFTKAGAGALVMKGWFSGEASVTVNGGTLTLANAGNGYTGDTTVNAGTLVISGKKTGTGNILVAAGAKLTTADVITIASGKSLTGKGTVDGTGNIVVAGKILPGADGDIGTLTIQNNVTLSAAGEYVAQINSTAAVASLLDLTGKTLTLDAASTLALTDLGNTLFTAGDSLTLAAYGSIFGNFAGYADGSTFTLGQNEWKINYGATALTLTAIPEPSTYALAGALALAGAALIRRRKNRR